MSLCAIKPVLLENSLLWNVHHYWRSDTYVQVSTFFSRRSLFTWRKRGGQRGRCSLVVAIFVILLSVREEPPRVNPDWLVEFIKARPRAGRFALPLDLPQSKPGAIRATVDVRVRLSSATPSTHPREKTGKPKGRTRSFLKSFNLGIVCLDRTLARHEFVHRRFS